MLLAHYATRRLSMGNFQIGHVRLMPMLRLLIWYSAICCAIILMARLEQVDSNYWHWISYMNWAE